VRDDDEPLARTLSFLPVLIFMRLDAVLVMSMKNVSMKTGGKYGYFIARLLSGTR
jgi:hypothetical protein